GLNQLSHNLGAGGFGQGAQLLHGPFVRTLATLHRGGIQTGQNSTFSVFLCGFDDDQACLSTIKNPTA
ncbi:MAG: hypothetical protein IIT51_08715, partial [Oscillospiraceae bacterium]|nr:hypothetical protein [Oscillospiraceae bacterium]